MIWVVVVVVVALLACALAFERGRARGFWDGYRLRERVARYHALHPLTGEAEGEDNGEA